VRRTRRPITSVLAGALLLIAPMSAAAQVQRKGDGERYDEMFRKYAKRYFGPGYDWRLFKAQGMAESNLDPNARSGVGAQGVMQLMPSTFRQIRSQQPELRSISDPEMNIGAGIMYDRTLWNAWASDSIDAGRERFMLASYNAGRRTILNAQMVARRESLDVRNWSHIARVAPHVPRWRYAETLGYVDRIELNMTALDDRGRLKSDSASRKGIPRR
jgi:membrane-bound lytic murein transglycosylase F